MVYQALILFGLFPESSAVRTLRLRLIGGRMLRRHHQEPQGRGSVHLVRETQRARRRERSLHLPRSAWRPHVAPPTSTPAGNSAIKGSHCKPRAAPVNYKNNLLSLLRCPVSPHFPRSVLKLPSTPPAPPPSPPPPPSNAAASRRQ